MTKVLAQTYTIAHEYRRHISVILLVISLVLALGYATALYRVISHTISVQHLATEAAAVDAAIQALDSQYLAISGKITPDSLHNYGFGKGEVTAFIPRSVSLGRVAVVGYEF